MSTLGPYRSMRRPTKKLETPAAIRRAVIAQPNWLRLIPKASPMVITNSPKLRFPVAMVEKLTSHMTATITQPKKIPLERIKPLSGGGK